MNQHLNKIQDLLLQNKNLSEADKETLIKAITDADKQWAITEFKLDRTEKVKKTTAILLEETIAELEQKRKAVEATNRELEIESSLERVRTVAMSMKTRIDMLEICRSVAHQLQSLNVKEIRNVQTAIFYPEKGTYMNYEYYAKHNKTFITETSYTNHEIHQAFANQMLKGNGQVFITHIKDEDVKDWIAYQKTTNVFIDSYLESASSVNYYWFSLGVVALGISTYQPLTEEEINLFKRFLKVFELAYRRYLDIEEAEAQAREAQIQLALERVRARTMAMFKSEELADTAGVLFGQVVALGNKTDRFSINIIDEQQSICEIWTTSHDGKSLKSEFRGDLNEKTTFQKLYNAWKNGDKSRIICLEGDELKEWLHYVKDKIGLPVNEEHFIYKRFHNAAFFSRGWLMFSYSEPASEEMISILQRFASVFNLTYTRFLDLQKAEAQAREVNIQIALERIRASALSMRSSDDFLGVTKVLREQLGSLGQPELESSLVHLYDEAAGMIEAYYSYRSPQSLSGELITERATGSKNLSSWTREVFEKYQSPEIEYTIIYSGEKLREHYKILEQKAPHTVEYDEHGNLVVPELLYYYFSKFSGGALLMTSNREPAAEARDLQMRAADVFDLAYTRFLDLKKSEAQAREAQIETALERVRSRTLAMQKSDELAETAAVLFKQLIRLGIAPNRLYIGIINDDSGAIEFWITDEDGTRVSSMFSGDANKNASMKKMHDGWLAQKKSIIIDMHGKELADYFHYLHEELHVPFKDGLLQKRRLQYISYFSKGFIGMASPDEQPQETVELVDRFAYVFNLTFTRFNDLKIAEAHALQAEQDLIEIKAARKKAEDTLSELQVTQRQLIQSEKMASLGELTAGIAHEIQNPLNFVNNFSEVNKELIEELKDERQKAESERNTTVEDEILNDIDKNLEKIAFHGKRADAIVKGMLQHSRVSSGQKEPTDINALCDEYLRLSYHGLRAKDKSFNAGFKTDFDKGIGKINVIPQDIGRVLLNLFNNAFYAVKPPNQPEAEEHYKPLVSVTTRKLHNTPSGDGGIEIRVEDNGPGISSNIIDKIFQPFYTTKPTGQGTGLGLSLAYDIITKEHNGTIKVESKEGEGSIFIIQLPV